MFGCDGSQYCRQSPHGPSCLSCLCCRYCTPTLQRPSELYHLRFLRPSEAAASFTAPRSNRLRPSPPATSAKIVDPREYRALTSGMYQLVHDDLYSQDQLFLRLDHVPRLGHVPAAASILVQRSPCERGTLSAPIHVACVLVSKHPVLRVHRQRASVHMRMHPCIALRTHTYTLCLRTYSHLLEDSHTRDPRGGNGLTPFVSKQYTAFSSCACQRVSQHAEREGRRG